MLFSFYFNVAFYFFSHNSTRVELTVCRVDSKPFKHASLTSRLFCSESSCGLDESVRSQIINPSSRLHGSRLASCLLHSPTSFVPQHITTFQILFKDNPPCPSQTREGDVSRGREVDEKYITP